MRRRTRRSRPSPQAPAAARHRRYLRRLTLREYERSKRDFSTSIPSPRLFLRTVEDLRRWTPDADILPPIAKRLDGRIAGVQARSPQPQRQKLWHTIRYESPKKVVRCQRRQKRREVIFASGHGGVRVKKKQHRRNEESNIRC